MKTFLLAVVLLLAASSFALDCNHCFPQKPGGDCTVSTVTCRPEKDACAAVKFLTPPYAHYQKCMKMSDCEALKTNSYINIKCCQEDLCNVF